MSEGDDGVLDKSCLLWVDNVGSGTEHDSTKVPPLTVGGLVGTLETGHFLVDTDRDDDNRNLCRFHLSILNRMEADLGYFGDAETPLATQ